MDLAVKVVVTRLALDLVVLGVLVPPARTDPLGDFPGDAIELT
jgi:hypothetical protein